MLCILVLVILLQLVLFIQSPSSDIWSKAMKYMQEGKMKYPKDMNYFIFDESNYTALEINGTEMNDLFLSQQELYKDFGIPNYIFIVDYQNEAIESLETATHNLADYLKTNYGVNKNRTIILFLSMQTRRNRIRAGESIKYIYGSYIDSMLKNLDPYLREKNYYEAWDQFLSDVYAIYKEYENNQNNKNNTNYAHIKSSDNTITPFMIVTILVSNLIFFGFIIFFCYICCTSKKQDLIRRNISEFLRTNRFNNNVFSEYCSICLQRLYVPTIQLTTNLNNQRDQNQIETITTFKCGHQFHTKCIFNNKLTDCVICNLKNSPNQYKENTEIIYEVQRVLYPFLYTYDNMITAHPKPIDTRSDSGYSYGGGYDAGSIGGGNYSAGGNDSVPSVGSVGGNGDW